MTLQLSPKSLQQLRATTRQADKLGVAIAKGARKAGLDIERYAKQQISGGILKVRSGSLRRSVTSRVESPGSAVELIVGATEGPASKYAPVHEFGKTIEPVAKKWLTIPVGPALTPAGVQRWPSALNVPVKLRFVKTRKPDTALLVADRTQFYRLGSRWVKGKEVVPKKLHKTYKGEIWYVLKKSVDIPQRNWLGRSIREMGDSAGKTIMAAIRDHLRSSNGP